MKAPEAHNQSLPIGAAEYSDMPPLMEDPIDNRRDYLTHASAHVAVAVQSRIAALRGRFAPNEKGHTRGYLGLGVKALGIVGAASAIYAQHKGIDVGVDHTTFSHMDTGNLTDAAPHFDLAAQHSPIDIQRPDAVPDAPATHTQPSAPIFEFSSDAKTISEGEGWHHQLSDMGIDHEVQSKLLQDQGPELQERGLAYFDASTNEWRMNLSDGTIAEDDLRWLHDYAADNGYLEVQTIEASDVDSLKIVVDADNQPVSEAAEHALEGIGVDNDALRGELIGNFLDDQSTMNYLKSEGVVTEVNGTLVFDTDKMTKLSNGEGYTLSDQQMERIQTDMQRFIDEHEKEVTEGMTAGEKSDAGPSARDDKQTMPQNDTPPSAAPTTSPTPSASASPSPSASSSPTSTTYFNGFATGTPQASPSTTPSPIPTPSLSPSPSGSVEAPAFSGMTTGTPEAAPSPSTTPNATPSSANTGPAFSGITTQAPEASPSVVPSSPSTTEKPKLDDMVLSGERTLPESEATDPIATESQPNKTLEDTAIAAGLVATTGFMGYMGYSYLRNQNAIPPIKLPKTKTSSKTPPATKI